MRVFKLRRTLSYKHVVYITLSALVVMMMSGRIIAADVESEPLKIVSFTNNAPFSFALPDGTHTGLYIEMWRLWSETSGIPIETQLLEFDESIQMVKDGEAIHSGLFINDSRLEWAAFATPIHEVDTGILYKDKKHLGSPLSTQTDILVAVQEGSFQHEYLAQNFPKLKLLEHNGIRKTLQDLLNGEVDAVVSELPFLINQVSLMGLEGVFYFSEEKLLTNTTHPVIQKDKGELVSIINDGFNSIPVEQLIALEKKWLPAIEPFFQDRVVLDSLTYAEQMWLSANNNLTLGVEHDYHPFEFVDQENNLGGIVGDYVQHTSDTLGLTLVKLTQYQWREAFELLKEGKIDVMAGVVRTDSRAELINFTVPYFSMPSVVVTKKGSFYGNRIEEYQNLKVGAIRGYVLNEFLLNDHPELNIIGVEGTLDGLRRVASGEIDAYIGALQSVNYEIDKNDLHELNITSVADYTYNFSFAVRKGLEPLVPILNKVIDGMSFRQRQQIANNWLAIQINEGLTLETILQWTVPVGTALFAIIVFFSLSNRRLSREISERRKVELQLQNASKIAEKANQAKSEFLASMSHEIRTPMNAVLGMCQVLRDSGLTEEQSKNLEVIHSSSDTLLMLINDILDLSKIESGKLELVNKPYQLNAVLTHLRSQIELLINNRPVEFHIHVADDVPEMLSGDRLRLGQILLNLCNNAAKFTHHGSIDLSIAVEHIDGDNMRVRFSVKDTGIGMSGLQMSRLFKTYSQADSSISRVYGGTGLGLAITKHLVELMNGDISVESEVEVGSTFTFRIHQQLVEQSPDIEDEVKDVKKSTLDMDTYRKQLAQKSVLIVDDNKVNLMVAEKLLTRVGIEVTTADDGQSAVAICEEKDFDAVLMDLQMPVLDGYAATILIRKQPRNTRLPIIALSANVMQSDIDRCYQVGMNAHLPKPLDMQRVIEALLKYTRDTD